MKPTDPARSIANASASLGQWEDLDALLWVVLSLVASIFFAMLREALERSLPSRTLAPVEDRARRARLEASLVHSDRLASSAVLLLLASQIGFALSLAELLFDAGSGGRRELALTLALAVPLLVLVTRGLSRALAASPLGDALLRSFLPTFGWLELPLRPFSAAVVSFEHAARRGFDLPATAQSRRIVEGLREAIEDAGREGDLDETEREIIENVVTFRDEAVASIMTPRTEVHGVERSTPLREALRIAAQAGHSRLPVYAETLDSVVGILSVRDCLKLISEEGLDGHELSELVRPATFVPETKRVFELLGDFRRQNLHMAVVLDEYGGTAGIVTLGDVLYELVGDLPDENEDSEPVGIRRTATGAYEIDAAERVSDVNAELDLELPEDQGYETLGGFVLAELGHFPSPGESFERHGLRLTVTRASDRRVLEVRLERPMAAAV